MAGKYKDRVAKIEDLEKAEDEVMHEVLGEKYMENEALIMMSIKSVNFPHYFSLF